MLTSLSNSSVPQFERANFLSLVSFRSQQTLQSSLLLMRRWTKSIIHISFVHHLLPQDHGSDTSSSCSWSWVFVREAGMRTRCIWRKAWVGMAGVGSRQGRVTVLVDSGIATSPTGRDSEFESMVVALLSCLNIWFSSMIETKAINIWRQSCQRHSEQMIVPIDVSTCMRVRERLLYWLRRCYLLTTKDICKKDTAQA